MKTKVFNRQGQLIGPIESARVTKTDAEWREAVAKVKRTHDELVETVATLTESRLRDQVPGKRYDFYHMLHGIAQHELYHAGQIAILKKAVKGLAKP